MLDPLRRAAREGLIAPIRFYKKHISPALGHHCRFTPTCSEYAMEAVRTHGCIKGLLLSEWRILRCNPFGKWGYDPVPEAGKWTNPKKILHPARQK
jgi:putative membrane protein insertion efficiency factor